MRFSAVLSFPPGPSCLNLMISLVKNSLKIQMAILQIHVQLLFC